MTKTKSIHPDLEKVLFSNVQIKTAVAKLANTLNKDYAKKSPIVIGIMKGCIPFYTELFMQLTCKPIMDFVILSSYQGTISNRTPKIVTDLRQHIGGRDIIIVEDIIDTGHTLKTLISILKLRKPKSIKVVCLIDKPACREVHFTPDHICFTVPPEFIVGYGLDYNEHYRNLPYVGVLKKSVYEKTTKGAK